MCASPSKVGPVDSATRSPRTRRTAAPMARRRDDSEPARRLRAVRAWRRRPRGLRAALPRLWPQPLVGAATAGCALLALAALWWRAPAGPGGPAVALAAGLALAVVAAHRFPLGGRGRTKLGLASVPYYLMAALLPAPLAAVAAGLGALGGDLSVRRARGLLAGDIASQVGRRVVVVALGALAAHLGADAAGQANALALVGAALTLGIGDIATAPLVLSPMGAGPPLRVIATVARDAAPMEGAQYLVGLLGALAAARDSWAVGLLVVPTALVYLTARALGRAEAAARALEHQATHDALTALPNRALFQGRLEQALAGAARGGDAVAVLFLDLDRFKVVNDSLGHAAGDDLLVAVAGRLAGCVRGGDTVARLGGDEFAVLLAGLGVGREATRTAERIIRALDAPFRLGGHDVVTATSIGIAVGGTGHAAVDLLRDADVALYRAKARGRGRYAVFDATMNARALERLELEADLRRALRRGEFEVYYQPKVDLATGRLAGLEALVRWRHPVRGVVGPGTFIPLAEETGLIQPLGQWVLEEACRQARRWGEAAGGGPAVVVSVNLSARQFAQPALVEDVARALEAGGADPRQVQLEITEGVAMGNAEATVEILRRLKGLGVGLAIDDFGTGYSSLAYLKRFPVDALKIDRAFVTGLRRETADSSIVGAVVGLGRALRLAVVAEGVETAEEAAQLCELGCALGQGYHFARPLPRAQVDALLRSEGARGGLDRPAVAQA